MKKSFKIVLVSIITIIGVSVICLIIFNPFSSAYIIGSIFSKNYNDEEPFSKNGLFVYENNGEDKVDVNRIEFTIEEYQKEQEYEVVFKSSKNVKYGIDFALMINDASISDYSVHFLKKEKELREPHHYYYLYFFELKTIGGNYVFDLEPKGENFLAFSFDEPINTYVLLQNRLLISENDHDN